MDNSGGQYAARNGASRNNASDSGVPLGAMNGFPAQATKSKARGFIRSASHDVLDFSPILKHLSTYE